MGFAASQARLLSLIARKSDLELEYMFVSQHKMYLGNAISGLFNMQVQLEPGSEAYRILEGRMRSLQVADKMLDMRMNQIDAQRKAVEKEVDSTREVVQKNIDSSFGLLGGKR